MPRGTHRDGLICCEPRFHFLDCDTPMQIACPHCQHSNPVGTDEFGGVKQCAACGESMTVPTAPPSPYGPPTDGSTSHPGDPQQLGPQQSGPQQFGPQQYGSQQYGVAGYADPVAEMAGKKIAAGICGILLGGLGVHKYILGFNTAGTVMLATTLVCSFTGACLIVPILGAMAMSVIGLIEGIIYLTKSDAEFYQLYGVQKKEWF